MTHFEQDNFGLLTNKEKEKKHKALIISGFPGVGKTSLCSKSSELKVLDSDSSSFSWADKSKQKRSPNWPQNYIDHIQDQIIKNDLILVSSHKEVRSELVNTDIPFVLVYPSLEMKEEYIQRYINRGNEDAFVKLLEANYDKWITELMEQKGCTHVVLKPGQYLSDIIFDNISS